MFILPLFSVTEYSLIRNTLSDLGAQSAPYAWIMNSVFVSLAAGSIIAGWEYFEGLMLQRIILVLLGISLLLMAFFNHAPVTPDIKFNIREDGWHAYFACTTVFSFTILSITTSFILERPQERLLARAAGISVVFLSVLMSEADQLAGVWQRLIYIISFGWMIFSFKTREF
jgi:hypothetical membrane protein